MSCIASDFYLNDDGKGKIKKAINEKVVSIKDRYVIAARVNSGEFHDWAYKNIDSYRKSYDEKKSMAEVDGNVLKRAINQFQLYLFPNVVNSADVTTGNSLNGFTSETAKHDAIVHTGNLIRDLYIEQFKLPEGQRLRPEDIFNTIINNIVKEFDRRSKAFIDEFSQIALSKVEEIENFKVINKEYEDTKTEIESIKKEILGIRNNINNLSKEDKEYINKRKELNGKLRELNNKFTTKVNDARLLKERKFALEEVIIDKYNRPDFNVGWRQLKNFTALYNRVKINNDGNSARTWFEQALTASNMIQFAKELKEGLESDKLNGTIAEDESTLENDNAENVDQTTKNWEDALASSYNKLYSTKLKMKLDSLYDLNRPIDLANDTDESISYNTDNELGARTSKGYKFYIQQLQTLGNYSSPEALMESIREKAYNVPELYALSVLYKEMKNDVVFRNYVYQQLKTPLIKKAIIQLRSNGVAFAWSNETAFPGSAQYFDMYHQLKLTYKTQFNINTLYDAIKYQNNLKQFVNSKIDFNSHRIKNDIYDFITNYFKSYFPNIDNKTIDNWLFGTKSNSLQTFTSIIDNIVDLEKGLSKFIDVQNKRDEQTNKELNEFNKKLRESNEAMQMGIKVDIPIKPQYEFLTDEYNKNVSVPLQNLTNIIIQNTVNKVDLNHANGENKLASDLISNSYITNIIEQIKTGQVDTKVGLENLYQIVSQNDQYIANPILFGLKDRNGRQLINGIFDVVGEITPKATHYINDEADKLLDFILFDGIRDEVSADGTTYTRMSKSDYFISQLIAFSQKFSNKPDSIGGYFLRVPSDAGKNFICETIKYNTIGLYKFQNYKEIVDTIKNNIDSKYSSLYNKNEDKNKVLANIRRTPSTYNKNRITAQQAFDLLNTGSISNLDISINEKDVNNNNEAIVPLIVTKQVTNKKGETSTVNSFVIFVKGKRNLQNNIENAEITSIYSLAKTGVEDLLSDYTSVQSEINNFINNSTELIESYAVDNNLAVFEVNKNLSSYLVLYNQVISEIRTFVNQLNNIFELDGNTLKTKDNSNIKGLYNTAQYEEDKKGNTFIVKDGKLTGGFFKFKKLFDVNGKNYSQRLMNALLLYGGGSTNLFHSLGDSGLTINENVTRTGNSFVKIDKSAEKIFSFQETPELREIVDNILSEWLYDYNKELTNFYRQYNDILNDSELGNIGNKDSVIAWGINYAITNMCFDDLLEGSTSFYEDSQTFLKRAKEVQMSGKAFASNTMNAPFGPITTNKIKKYDITNGNERVYSEDEIILIKQRVYNEDGSVSYEIRPYEIPRREDGQLNKLPMTARNGFRAISIKNTIKPYDLAEDLRKQVYEETLKKVNDKEIAKTVADNIAKGYIELTKVNDAQSYITLDEFIRRRYLDGTLDEYQDILAQLLDPKLEAKDLNLAEINAKIQVQKNVYYDINYDAKTNTYVPRQIKNAEFVLIPKLLPKNSDLRKLADLMQEYDINQINTEETLKAGKKNVLTLWDNKGEANFDSFVEELKNEDNVENYYYQYLYKQQDVVDHIQDERNKFGIQIAKKIQDNASTSSKKVQDAVDTLQRNYVANIKSSFDKLIFNLGFTTDEKGVLCNRYYRITDTDGNPLTAEEIQRNKYTLDFKEFYKRARTEAQRLGMDNNFMDYLTPNALGVPEMPNWYNVSSMKLESIAQSIFNSMIARQTLPGWHAAQITNVGYSRKLKYHPDVVEKHWVLTQEDGSELIMDNDEVLTNHLLSELSLTPSDFEGKTPRQYAIDAKIIEEKEIVVHQGYMEVLLPRWSKLLPQRPENSSMSQEEWDAQLLKQLEEEGLDLHIGYRIPTEGKQSVSVLKVVGFLDESYGSTIMVPDEWVTQTGSDFDVDTVYGINYEFYRDKNGKFKKIETDTGTKEEDYQRRYIAYVNNLIKERIKEDNNYQYANANLTNIYNEYKALNKATNTKRPFAKAYKAIMDIRNSEGFEAINTIIEENTKYAKIHKFNELETIEETLRTLNDLIEIDSYSEQKENIKKLIEYYSVLAEQYRAEDNNEGNDSYSNYTFKEVKELRDKAKKDYFDAIKTIAKKLNIISYENFKTIPLEEQQNQKARNNAIVDAMITIMLDSTTLEENLSRSNFDDIRDAKDELEEIDPSLSFNSMSPYSPITQLQFFENAINGRKLKAFSVDRDTNTSVCNKLQVKLTEGNEIIVEYDASKYNRELLVKNGYTVHDITRNGKQYYRVTHDMLGWSETNRNVVGKLITAYSSQTTAHILDAIKMGALYNETDYTFGTFKTLIDVGIDYETAVMFLAQPAITLINSYNFQKQSVFVDNNLNPIDSALRDIARKVGIKVGKDNINKWTPIEDILNSIKTNGELFTAIQSQFAGSILNDISSNDTNIVLNKDMLVERLKKGQSTEDYMNSNGEVDYEKAAFDIGMILAFRKFFSTTKTIEKVSRLINPDSFGARQTVHETRMKIDNIISILNNPKDKANTILRTKDGKIILESLYPRTSSDISSVNPYESSYPYLAAMLKYATDASVNINSRLFRFENDDIVHWINQFQLKLGIVLNEEQYVELKNYIVSSIYYSLELLNTPQTVNDSGFIIPDVKKAIENNTFDYWNDEISRVFGYKEYQEKVEIKDINNPTEEELDKFTSLTPLQKVIWIQQHFAIENTIFEVLKTYKYSGRRDINNDYSNNVIRYNDTIYNQEEILNKFEQAYFNKNKLIKLTAIDLIKYSFLVEGFRFKKGSISKIIKNSTIKNPINGKGENLVDMSQVIMNDRLGLYIDEFTDKFVRSHPEITKEIKFNKDARKDSNNSIFNTLKDETGLVFIPFTKDYQDFAKNFLLETNSKEDEAKALSHVRVRSYSSTGEKQQTLYKIYIAKDAGIYLIPLNLLNRNEVTDYSINNDNNKFYSYDYYQQVIDNAQDEMALLKVRKENGYTSYTDLLGQRKNYAIPKYNYYEQNTDIKNPNYLLDLATDENADISKIEKTLLKNFFNRIDSEFGYYNTNDGYMLIDNDSAILAKVIKGNNSKAYINASINGKNSIIEITKYRHNLGINSSKKQLTEQEKEIKDRSIERKSIRPNVYKIKLIPEQETIDEVNKTIDKAIEEKYEDNPSLLSGLEGNTFEIGRASLNTSEFEDTDKVGKFILDDIYFREIKASEESTTDFFHKLAVQGINRQSLRSIKENRKSVYTSAAKYYKDLANKLIYEIENFYIGDEKFTINSKNLYKKLKDNPEDATRLIKLMLDAKTFGRTIDGIFNLDITSEDSQTKDAIDSIRESINKVKDNAMLKKAFDNIFNIYLVEQYSNNPNYAYGVSFATDSWRDANFFEMNISDIKDLNNKEVQIIVKAVSNILATSRFTALRNQENFRKALKELLDLPGEFKWSDIIDKDGKIKHKYVDAFLKDKTELRNKVTVAYNSYQESLKTKYIEHIIDERIKLEKVILERDKWFAENVEQEVIGSYYKQLNTAREKILNEAPRQFAEYRVLGDIINKNYADVRSLSEDERTQRHNYFIQRSQLISHTYSDGREKEGVDADAAIALNEYIKIVRDLSDTYFVYEPTEDFKNALKQNLAIIEDYDRMNPDKTLYEKLKNDKYFDAYYWIKDNVRRKLTKDVQELVAKAFDALRYKEDLPTNNPLNPYKSIYDKVDNYDKYDAFGIINGLAFEKYVEEHPDDDIIQKLKDITEEINDPYGTRLGTKKPDHILSDNALIKEIPADLPVFNDAFYAEFRTPEMKSPEMIAERFEVITKINNLLSNGIDPKNGQISTKYLFENLSEDELKELARLYQTFRDINREMYDNLEKAEKNNIVELHNTDNPAFKRELGYFEDNVKGTALKRLWVSIFCEMDRTGMPKLDDAGNYIPNHYMFGYYTPTKKYYDKYIDKKKTNARKFITENIRYEKTQHYERAVKLHTERGDYNEWYVKNHYYNPYTRKMEPLRIWTTMEVNPSLGKEGTYEYTPTYINTRRTIKDGMANTKYRRYSTNYNMDTGRYTNEEYNKLSDKAKRIAEFVQNTLNENAASNDMQKWFAEGYMPRKYRPNIDPAWVAKNVFGAVGLEMGNYRNTEWHDHISYEKDFDADFDMSRELRAKGYEEYKKPEKQQEGQSDTQYQLYLQDLTKENEEIRKRNLERERAIRDENWEKVLEEFIGRVTEYKARVKAKDFVYLGLEDLRTRQSYKTTPFGKLSRRKGSPVEEEWYNTTAFTNTITIFENWARRFLFEEYKKPSPFRATADLLQNITSAKYMIFNVTGGVSNVTTGLVNMLGEAFAGQFFSMKEFAAAQAKYIPNGAGFIATMWKDTAPNLTIALAKNFEVVDFDAMVERKPGESAAAWAERSRNLLYGLQSGGEHYMQNTVLFAMLKSHRTYRNRDGKIVFGSLNDYLIDIDYVALENVIKDNPEFVAKLDMMKKDIRRDKDLQKDYDTFQRDFNQDFIKSIVDRKIRNDIAKKYIAERDRLRKEAKEKFYTEGRTLEDQYELVDGKAKLKADADFTEEMEGAFKEKVQQVNTKIHGVYNKLGAAKIESEWWGGLVMQYHKHLYPGIMKRYRKQGYFNEIRGIIEQGSYQSFWNLLTKDFNGIKKRIQELHNDGTNIALASLQEVAKSTINCILNIKFNYSTSPVWMQQNMRRALGDLLGIASAIIAAIAIYALTDDDDREDSDLINTGIYLADRLFSESQMYLPWGLPAEASTMWSSPIAAQNGPTDLLKGLNYIGQYIFNDEFEPEYTTGLYRGQNKLAVLVKRNIPFWRVINRLDNMAQNNQYYRINENSFNIGVAENIANKLKGEE